MHDWFYPHKQYGVCLTWKSLTDCGVSYKTLEGASARGSKTIPMVPHPEHGKMKLVVWNKLAPTYREKIFCTLRKLAGCKHGDAERCNCGDPATYIAKQPIRELVELDFKAEEFFRTRMIELKAERVSEYVSKYTQAASWLNMLIKMDADKRFVKKTLGLRLDEFFKNVCEIIKSDGIDLPTSYHRLRDRMKEYSTGGYDCLISKQFGNKRAAKIGKTDDGFDTDTYEKQLAFIRKAASMHQNFDSHQIAAMVNPIFEKNGWATLSDSTVYNVMRANEHLTKPGRRGKRTYHAEMAMQVVRKRPDYPLHFLSLDGWTVELLYQDGNTYNNRMVMVVVVDATNNYPLGYAIGQRENVELILLIPLHVFHLVIHHTYAFFQ